MAKNEEVCGCIKAQFCVSAISTIQRGLGTQDPPVKIICDCCLYPAWFCSSTSPLLNTAVNFLWNMVFIMDKGEGPRHLPRAGLACLKQAFYDSLNFGDFHENWNISVQPLPSSFQLLAVFHFPLLWKSQSIISDNGDWTETLSKGPGNRIWIYVNPPH